MAYDKVVDSTWLEAGLKKVGDSIRAKAGTSALLEFPDAMSAAVDAIATSKPEQTKTATPSLSQQTIVPDSGKVLSGVTINPITAALLTSLDPDFKEANIAEGVNMFGLVGALKAGGSLVYASGNITVDSKKTTATISGLSFAPRAVLIYSSKEGKYFATLLDNGDTHVIPLYLGNTTTASPVFTNNGFSVTITGSYYYFYASDSYFAIGVS